MKYNPAWVVTVAGIYFRDPEITPSGRGQYRFNESGNPVETFPPEVEVRAVIEGQIMAKLYHAQLLGYEITPSSRVLATGGASQNSHICQVCLGVAHKTRGDIYLPSYGSKWRCCGISNKAHLHRNHTSIESTLFEVE